MRRRVKPGKGGKSGNELNGRDVIDDPPAGKRGRPSKYNHLTNYEAEKQARDLADSRHKLSGINHALYRELKNRGLLEETFGLPLKRGRKRIIKTPEWVLEINPEVPKRLPLWIVEDLNMVLGRTREWREMYGKIVNSLPLQRYAVLNYMNNFHMRIIDHIPRLPKDKLGEKIGETRGEKVSELMKNQSYEEFFEIVKKTVEECGLSLEKAKELGRSKGTVYLLPAFLKLMEKGYKRYPDLGI